MTRLKQLLLTSHRFFPTQAWLVAEGYPHMARLLRESRRTLEGELKTGRCYHEPDARAELDRAGGEDALIDAFHSLGDPLPLEDGSDCFAAQLPRVVVRMLRALLPLVAAHPPRNQRRAGSAGLRGNGEGVGEGAVEGAELALGGSLYGLAAASVELLATLAAHGAAAEVRAVGLDGSAVGNGDAAEGDGSGGGVRGAGKDSGGRRWVKEIAVGFGGADGGGGAWGGGRGLEVLEACWVVARDVDGVQGE